MPGLLAHVGSNDYHGAFYDTGYFRNSPEKQRQREYVLDFILKNTRSDQMTKLLSLPGMSWSFENMMIAARVRTHLICLESSATIFHATKRVMPGNPDSHKHWYTKLQDRTIHYGNATIYYSRISRYLRTNKKHKKARSNRILLMDSATFMSMLVTDFGATMDERLDFRDRFYLRNAVWLDFTSNLCKSVERTLENLLFCLTPKRDKKPVVVTILNGRDSCKSVDARISRMMDIQPALEYQDHQVIRGKGGCSMLTTCFTAI